MPTKMSRWFAIAALTGGTAVAIVNDYQADGELRLVQVKTPEEQFYTNAHNPDKILPAAAARVYTDLSLDSKAEKPIIFTAQRAPGL